MRDTEIRNLAEQVKSGRLPRRHFIQRMAALGLSAPLAGMLLTHHGVAFAQPSVQYRPKKAGTGGPLKILQW